MLRTNLSTRPFYNERAVHVALGAVALLVLALTVFNVTDIVRLSRENTELGRRIAADESEARRLATEAAGIRRAINRSELEVVAAAAREANDLIDQRTFSWTAFFNHIEATLPPDVMLVAVRPSVREQRTHVSISVLARRTEDIEEFQEKLEATGAFEDIYPAQRDSTGQGLQRAVLEAVYTAAAAEPETVGAAGEPAPTPGTPEPGRAGGAPEPGPAGTAKSAAGARR